MYYGYFVKNNEGTNLYYYVNGDIVKKNSASESLVATDIKPPFYMTQKDNSPVIIYKGNKEGITMVAGGQKRLLQQNYPFSCMSCIIEGRGTRLIYINESNGCIVTIKSNEGVKEEAIQLDRPVGVIPYSLIPMVKGGYALMYVRKTSGSYDLGYREIAYGGVGAFKRLYSTNFMFGDSSLCVEGDTVHLIFTTISPFAIRVMYSSNSGKGFGRAKTLWEGNRCKWVCINAVTNRIFAYWESGGSLFTESSQNYGEDFSACKRQRLSSTACKVGCIGFGYGLSQVAVNEQGKPVVPEELLKLSEI